MRLCSLLRGGGRPLATWPQLPRPVPAAVVAARASTAPLEEVEFDPAAGNSVSFIGSCIRIEQPRVFASGAIGAGVAPSALNQAVGNSKLELAISVRNAGAPATAPLEERSLVWCASGQRQSKPPLTLFSHAQGTWSAGTSSPRSCTSTAARATECSSPAR